MVKGKEYIFYIGLKKSNMETNLNKNFVLNSVINEFNKYKILGFNVDIIKGFWNGNSEDTLKISFINTYGLTLKEISLIANNLKSILEQECILIDIKQTDYLFI